VGRYAAETFVASDCALAWLPERQRDDVVEALVITLVVMVLDVFTHDRSKMPLSNRHDVPKTLGLDRPNEALGVGVAVGALRRNWETGDAGGLEDRRPRFAPGGFL
jgi:hypothetical protein